MPDDNNSLGLRVAVLEEQIKTVNSTLDKVSDKLDVVHDSNVAVGVQLQNLNDYIRNVKDDYIGQIREDVDKAHSRISTANTEIVKLKISVAKISVLWGAVSGIGAGVITSIIAKLLGG